MNLPYKRLLAASLVLALAACGSEPPPGPDLAQPEGSGQTGTPASSTGDTSASQGLSHHPQPLANCLSNQVVEIRWALAPVGDATSVEILLVDSEGTERAFARSGMEGSKMTGPWARPGQVFIARDPATREEMARLTLQGKGC